MKRVVVLGGGPAGAVAAQRLASGGIETILIDEKLAWEKPCGGGLTYKAYNRYPFLKDNDTPKRVVTETVLSVKSSGTARLLLRQPLLIYSRYALNNMLLERAGRAGAQIEKSRVMAVERAGAKWRVQTRNSEIDADFCVVAMGARNPFRHVGTEWTPADTMTALGYYVPTSQAHVDIQFFPQFEGYIWVFPRCEHLSVGICGKGVSAKELRLWLERYMNEKGISFKDAEFYGHMLPSLETPNWKRNRLAGDGWLAAGDAAGLVDPITGEGLYYAIRSGDLAGQIILDGHHAAERKPAAYSALLRQDFLADLEYGSTIAKRFFTGRFFFSGATARMIDFMKRSPRFHDLMQDLFAGTQDYLGLKQRVFDQLQFTLREAMVNGFLRRIVVG